MTNPALQYMSLLEVNDAIRTRKLSPLELTRFMLDRIAELDATLHSYVAVTADLALEQAARAEQEIVDGNYRGVLHGVPIAVKDICYTVGVPTTAGMTLHANTPLNTMRQL